MYQMKGDGTVLREHQINMKQHQINMKLLAVIVCV